MICVRFSQTFRAAVFQFDDKNILNAPNRKVYAACVRGGFPALYSSGFQRIVQKVCDNRTQIIVFNIVMKNIEAAVQKYDGILQTAYADHIFQTTITMCLDRKSVV